MLYLIWTTLCIPQGKIWLLLDPVQIFMESVQQEGQKLLGVLLLVARKLGGKTSNLRLKIKTKSYLVALQ